MFYMHYLFQHVLITYPDDVICISYVLSDAFPSPNLSICSVSTVTSMQVENLVTDVNNMRADFQGAAETARGISVIPLILEVCDVTSQASILTYVCMRVYIYIYI